MARFFGKNTRILWTDKKHYFGLPISFTRYTLVEKENSWLKIFLDTGLFSTRHEETNLYRIFDISVTQTIFDKIFGLGTIYLYCNEEKTENSENMTLIRVKDPFKVRNQIAELVEKERKQYGYRIGEIQTI